MRRATKYYTIRFYYSWATAWAYAAIWCPFPTLGFTITRTNRKAVDHITRRLYATIITWQVAVVPYCDDCETVTVLKKRIDNGCPYVNFVIVNRNVRSEA
ncbi:hypothetical protein D3C76_1512070 [compost metagenome]